jgi:hypothetical protein
MRQHPQIATRTVQTCGVYYPAGFETREATTTLDSCLDRVSAPPDPPFSIGNLLFKKSSSFALSMRNLSGS